jgi:hypothetical protein
MRYPSRKHKEGSELDVKAEEDEKYQQYSKYLYLVFILFCGVYLFLYGA